MTPAGRDFADLERARRIGWIQLLEKALVVAQGVARGDSMITETMALRDAVDRAQRVRFPLRFGSASAAAAGFLQLAGGFVDSSRTGLRDALAEAMAGAAKCCLRMLEIDDAEAAATAARRWPGGD